MAALSWNEIRNRAHQCINGWKDEDISRLMRAWGAAGKNATEIRTFYDSHPNITREELARIFDVSQSTIKGLSLGMDETRRDKAAKQTEEIRAFKVAHPDMSNRDIGAALGVSRQTVNNAVKKSGQVDKWQTTDNL